MHEAAKYTGLERLGVSTQCGFSSTLPGANLTTRGRPGAASSSSSRSWRTTSGRDQGHVQVTVASSVLPSLPVWSIGERAPGAGDRDRLSRDAADRGDSALRPGHGQRDQGVVAARAAIGGDAHRQGLVVARVVTAVGAGQVEYCGPRAGDSRIGRPGLRLGTCHRNDDRAGRRSGRRARVRRGACGRGRGRRGSHSAACRERGSRAPGAGRGRDDDAPAGRKRDQRRERDRDRGDLGYRTAHGRFSFAGKLSDEVTKENVSIN